VLLGKSASISIGHFTILNIFTNGYYISGIICLVLQSFFWMIALKKYPLSTAYFFMSNVYVVILFGSYFIFHEKITVNNIIGSIFIVFGVYILFKRV
jgi:drug/metabolite transporter (DMT)-like permease